MAVRPVSIVLIAATVAAIGVWLVTVAAFDPGAYVDDRPYCSGIPPYTTGGVRVEPTLPPSCRFGPIPADALGPSPVPAAATFVLIIAVGLFAREIATTRRHTDSGH